MLESALLEAIEAGDDASVGELLARGASPEARTPDGWPALLLAIDQGRVGAARALLDHGADRDVTMEGNSALLVAALRGHTSIARMLMERGADVNRRGGEGDSPLKAAAALGNAELVELLLDAGADPEYAGGLDASTALGVAAAAGHPDVVRLLLDRGADAAARDIDDYTALERALSENSLSPSEQRDAAIRILQEALGSRR